MSLFNDPPMRRDENLASIHLYVIFEFPVKLLSKSRPLTNPSQDQTRGSGVLWVLNSPPPQKKKKGGGWECARERVGGREKERDGGRVRERGRELSKKPHWQKALLEELR